MNTVQDRAPRARTHPQSDARRGAGRALPAGPSTLEIVSVEAPTIEGDAAIEHLLADERAALYLGVHLCRLLQLSRRDNSVVAEIASAGIVAEAGALLNAHPALHSVVQEWFTAIGGQAAEPADLTAQEAAEALGLLGRDGKPTDTFYRLAADKEKLAGYQVGKQWRIPTAHLRAFKQQRSKR